ncbi:hypothetical protein DBB_38630 [Desulfoluna spongiiphila]|nr:hypothetical protein DBB_38630 [Desulfoluna spongiiphila]
MANDARKNLMLHGLPIIDSQNSLITIFHTNLQTSRYQFHHGYSGAPREPTPFPTHVQEAMDALPVSPFYKHAGQPVFGHPAVAVLSAIHTPLTLSKIGANTHKKALTSN